MDVDISVIAVKICPDSEVHNPAIGGAQVQGQGHVQSTPTSPLSLAAGAV